MSGSVRILDLNAYDVGSSDGSDPLLERRLANVGAASVLFYRRPIEMVSARGAWMTAADGTRYLDFYNNVPSVGHCHPRVVEAVAAQLAKLNTNTRYLNATVEDYLDRLKATLPSALSNVLLSCSGSEANDLAMRVAMASTEGTGFIVTDNAYHGNTAYVTMISPAALKRSVLPDHVVCVPAPDPQNFEGANLGKAFAASVQRAIKELKSRGHKLAALICDSIFSSDGIYADPPGFLKEAVAVVKKAGGLYIADEVQPGFARTGDTFWGFGRHRVTPDIVTMGKPMGNGFPMAGMATRPELLECFCQDVGYFNTFGGSPVAAAAGMAVLSVVEDEGLQANSRKIGAYLKGRLLELAKTKSCIGDVRGAGLFIGLDLVHEGKPDAIKTVQMIDALKANGILIGAAGKFANTLKLRPPLCLTQDEADHFVDVLEKAL